MECGELLTATTLIQEMVKSCVENLDINTLVCFILVNFSFFKFIDALIEPELSLACTNNFLMLTCCVKYMGRVSIAMHAGNQFVITINTWCRNNKL